MSESFLKLLKQELKLPYGLVYLVPKSWWRAFRKINKKATSIQQFRFPTLNFSGKAKCFIQEEFNVNGILKGFLSPNHSLAINQNRYSIMEVIINEELREKDEWRMVSPTMWNLIRQGTRSEGQILGYHNPRKYSKWPVQSTTTLMMVFCTGGRCSVFLGHVDERAELKDLIVAYSQALNFENPCTEKPEKKFKKRKAIKKLPKKKREECRNPREITNQNVEENSVRCPQEIQPEVNLFISEDLRQGVPNRIIKQNLEDLEEIEAWLVPSKLVVVKNLIRSPAKKNLMRQLEINIFNRQIMQEMDYTPIQELALSSKGPEQEDEEEGEDQIF